MRSSVALIVGIVLSGCRCGQASLVHSGPHAQVDPLLEFGKVRVASRVVKPIELKNDGRQVLTVQVAVDASTDPSFRALFTPDRKLEISAGEVVQLPIEYIPAATGEHKGKVTLETNSEGASKIEIAIHGIGVTSTLQICRLDPAGEACNDKLAAGDNLAVDFGQVRPGSPAERKLVMRALGDAPIHIARLKLTPQSEPGYALLGLPALPIDLQPGQEQRFSVTWTPFRGGPAPSQIEVLSDSASRPRELIDLDGLGIAPRLCIAKADLDFGEVTVGTTARKTAQLKSCGVEPLRIDALSTSAPFAIDAAPALPQTLQPGATLALPLSFSPTATGLQEKPLTAATNETRASTFTLTGEGVQCVLALSPGRLDLGQVSTAAKASGIFYLRSVGYSRCTVTAMRGPTGTAGFTFTPPALPLAIAVGMEVPVPVEFQPRAPGTASAQIAVDSNDSTQPTQIEQLAARGIDPPPCDFAAQPASVQFGSVDVGKSATVPVVVTNRGADECYVTGGGASGDPSFSAKMPGGFPPPTVASGASVTIPVTFAPTSSAPHSGTLTVKYNKDPVSIGGGQTLSVPLQGGTLTPKMCLTPTLLDFGTVAAGSRAVKSFVIESCGEGTLTVRGIQPAPGTSRDFSLASPPPVPLVLAKGTSATINVAYQPSSAAGAAGAAGRIEVYSNDPSLPTGKVELKGNLGTCATLLVCAPQAVDFPGTEVGRTSAQPVTCIAAAGAVTISGVAVGPGSSPDITLAPGPLPVTLQPGGALRAEVQFAPSGPGAKVASFTLQTGGCGDATIPVTAIGLPQKLPPCPPISAFTPKVKWAWNGGNKMKDWSNVTMTPVVANLDDDNGDGAVDETDVPDVVFASCSPASCCVNCTDPQHSENWDLSGKGVLRAVSGKDGSERWTADAESLRVPAGSQIAVADINADGEPRSSPCSTPSAPARPAPTRPSTRCRCASSTSADRSWCSTASAGSSSSPSRGRSRPPWWRTTRPSWSPTSIRTAIRR